MTEEPFFSVVILLYNKEPHVDRSVGSVLNQTFRDFELIIVNDASTDGSVDEVLKFNNPRIRLLQGDYSGSGDYAARNLGIKEVKSGTAVLFKKNFSNQFLELASITIANRILA